MIKSLFIFSAIFAVFLSFCTNRDSPGSSATVEGYIDVDDSVRLFYNKVGDGKEKLIVPAALYLYEGLRSLTDSGDRTIVFYDPRNRGRSSHITDSSLISIWKDVDDLEKVRKHFGFENISVLGWSYLGMMVMLYSSQFGEHVDRVVQVGPVALKWDTQFPPEFTNTDPPPYDTFKIKEVEKLLKEGIQLKEPRAFTEKWYKAFVFPGLFGDSSRWRKYEKELLASLEGENELYHNFMWHLSHHFEGSVMHLNADSLWPVVKKFTKPVLTIHGTKDRNAVYGAGIQWVKELPNAKLLTIEGAGHLPWYEQKEFVLHNMNVFLNGKWPAAAKSLE